MEASPYGNLRVMTARRTGHQLWRVTVITALAAVTWGCSCSSIGIEGQADTSTENSADAGDDDRAVAVCGNGAVDDGEECDDGNADDCDGCNGECRWMRALQVDGEVPGAYVDPGMYPCLACPYTVEAWFRFDLEDSAVEFFRILPIMSMVSGTTEYEDLLFYRTLGGGFSMDPRSPGVGIPIDPGSWHHFVTNCWFHSGDGHHAIFLDGKMIVSGIADTSTPVCTGPMIILDQQREVDPAPYPLRAATIDDLRISNQGLYGSDFTPERHLAVRPDTVALWSFDQETDGIVHDVSGNGHDAMLAEGALVPDDCHLP